MAMKRLALLLTAAGIGLAGVSSAQAASYDLTASGSSATINGGIYSYITLQPTGTGVFGSFLRLQQQGNGSTEAAYNTDLRPLPANDSDAKNDVHTRSVNVGALQDDGCGYYTFTLDVYEPNGGSQPAIDLTGLKVFLGTSGNEGPSNIDDLGNLVYDLGSNVVNMTDHGSGSGTADYSLKILKSAFDAQNTDNLHNFVYLYSAFSSTDGGFEEWAANTGVPLPPPPPPPPSVPLPAAVWSGLGMLGLLGAEGLRRKSRKVLA
jgi:hypothetical protein